MQTQSRLLFSCLVSVMQIAEHATFSWLESTTVLDLLLRVLFVTTIPGIWIYPGAVFPISWDIHIPGLFDDFRITNSGMLKNHGIYLMLISRMNSLMLHRI